MKPSTEPARDFELFEIRVLEGVWSMWWQPTQPDSGLQYGSDGICITADGGLVIISEDGKRWDLPGGRTDPGETWEQTLRREVWEEACVKVVDARLLGFWVGDCTSGKYQGERIVRSQWLATVEVADFAPEFETCHRNVVDVASWREHVRVGSQFMPFIERAFQEARPTVNG